MSRPASLSGDLIAVDVDGRRATWVDGRFRGDPVLVAYAEDAALAELLVEWGRLPVPEIAGADDARSALAALMAFSPGRTVVTAWPDWLRDWWEAEHWQCSAEADLHVEVD